MVRMVLFKKSHNPFGNILRINEIVSTLIKHGLGYYVHKLKLANIFFRLFMRKFEQPEGSSIPYRLRMVLEELGPTFIKLGQLLSVRPDLVPVEYANELSKLQDSVKPFSYQEAKEIIESELHKKLEDIFQYINEIPVASASIGQVYKAKLKSGELVAVKVQRPYIEETIKSDIRLAKYIANLADNYLVEISKYDPIRIVRELEKFLMKELDYIREGTNMEIFHKNFANDPTIKIPKVHWEYTSGKVLITSYVDGIKLSDIGKLHISDTTQFDIIKERVVNNYFRAMTKMILEDGIYHADPHPSNVIVLKKNIIAFLDFGIIGKLNKDALNNINQLTFAIFKGDGLRFAEIILSLGSTQGNVEEFEISMKQLIDQYNHPDSYDINLSGLWTDVLCLSRKYEHFIPEEYNLVFKAIITAEGTARSVNPNFNVLTFLKDYTEHLSTRRNSIASIIGSLGDDLETVYYNVKSLPSDLRNVLKKIQHGQLKIELKDDTSKRLSAEVHRASNRIALGLVLAALLTTIPNLVSFQGSNRLFFILIWLITILGTILILFLVTEIKIK